MDLGQESTARAVSSAQTDPQGGSGLGRLRVLAWIFVFLLGAELAMEARAFQRGWEVLLLRQARGANRGQEVGLGPTPNFPFRSRIFDAEAPGPDLRVWLASSSYAEALEYPANEIFPVLMGDLLDSEDRPARVLNSSRMGLTIRSNLADLTNLSPRWHPDVCILYQLSNDIDWIVENQLTRDSLALEAPSQPVGPGGLGLALDRFVEESTLYKHLQTQISSRLAGARPLRKQLHDDELDAFRTLVIAFVQECRSLKIQPILSTFAFAHPDPSDMPAEWARLLLRSNMHLAPEGWSDAVRRGNEILRSVAEEYGLVLVDLDAALSGHPERFRDPWHFDAEGHRIAAEIMADAVRRACLSN